MAESETVETNECMTYDEWLLRQRREYILGRLVCTNNDEERFKLLADLVAADTVLASNPNPSWQEYMAVQKRNTHTEKTSPQYDELVL